MFFRVVKFSSVHYLTLYFPRNFGSETTKVYYIGLRGEFSEAHRHGVTICTYEARPNVADHKTSAFDSVSHEVQWYKIIVIFVLAEWACKFPIKVCSSFIICHLWLSVCSTGVIKHTFKLLRLFKLFHISCPVRLTYDMSNIGKLKNYNVSVCDSWPTVGSGDMTSQSLRSRIRVQTYLCSNPAPCINNQY
jgi:hypothetical protein